MPSQDVPITEVTLSNAGLIQCTHGATLAPGTTAQLSVRLSQVDDVLKSLVVLDDESDVGPAKLPAQDAFQQWFSELPLEASELNSFDSLLEARRGEPVRYYARRSQRKIEGQLLDVALENVLDPECRIQSQRRYVSILTSTGVQRVPLEDYDKIDFEDTRAHTEIRKALDALVEHRKRGRRVVSLDVLGEKARMITFSYIALAPVWKASYRLILHKEKKPELLGFAVVENHSGNDWTNVRFHLTSGSPVALSQDLYTAFYTMRPKVAVETAQKILPKKDTEEIHDGHIVGGHFSVQSVGNSPGSVQVPQARGAPGLGTGARCVRAKGGKQPSNACEGSPNSPHLRRQVPVLGSGKVAETDESANQVSFSCPPITLRNGETMLIPFLSRQIQAHSVYLYQYETHCSHPLAAVQVTNDSDSAIPAGIVTSFDSRLSHIGDAQLPNLPQGSLRFLTFAIDTKTSIRREEKGTTVSVIGVISEGSLREKRTMVQTISYEITAPKLEDRTIVIDEPRLPLWSAVRQEGLKLTESSSRVRLTLDVIGGKTRTVELRLERVVSESYQLSNLNGDDVVLKLNNLANTSESVTRARKSLESLYRERKDLQKTLNSLAEEREALCKDQERIRANLKVVGGDSEMGDDYLSILRRQEKRFIEMGDAERKTKEEVKQIQEEIRSVILGISL